MKFKTDENMPAEAAEMLREAGHDALSVVDQALGGWADPSIAQICRDEQRVLVTLDVDFADLRSYPPEAFAGIIVLRLKRQDRDSILEALDRVLRLFGAEPVEGCLWIVSGERVRIRGGR
jgi:predicted nuclease of predicted toxin-antitoxin system